MRAGLTGGYDYGEARGRDDRGLGFGPQLVAAVAALAEGEGPPPAERLRAERAAVLHK
jgi:hypothetical protein